MTDERYNLSRRKALVGLATIGAAGAGAGLGTSAYFSDQESFDENIFTAGSLNLRVNVDTAYHGAGGGISAGPSGTVDGEGTGIDLSATDVKPGDWGVARFCFEIIDNPAYLWTCGELTKNEENGRTEPEREVDSTADPESNMDGELAQALQAVLFYCPPGVEHGDLSAEGAHPGDPGYDVVSYIENNFGPVVTNGSLASILSQLDNGLQLDGAPIPLEGGMEGRQPFAGGAEAGNPCLCMLLYLPRTVGNEVQTDIVGFDLAFHAVQSRHNDGSVNPCITGNNVEGFGKFAYWDDSANFVDPWFGKVRNQNPNSYELEVGNAPGSSDTADFVYGGSSYSGELEVSYDAGSGTATLDFDDTTVTYDVDDTPGDVISVVARGNDASHFASATNVQFNETTPSGSNAVEADGDEINSLNIESVDTGTSWELTADLTFEGLGGPSDENPAVYVDVLDTP